MKEKDRIERIISAGEIWSHCYFYHPQLSIPDRSWEEALIASLPAIDSAETPQLFAEALNYHLLSALNDSLAIALPPPSEADRESTSRSPDRSSVPTKKLRRGVGYIDSREVSLYKEPHYVRLFGTALRELGSVDSLVLDLRWAADPGFLCPWPALLASLFADPSPCLGWPEGLTRDGPKPLDRCTTN